MSNTVSGIVVLQRGFSLVEMAMVLVIIGLLLGGLLMPLTAQIDQQKIGETRKSLAEIKEALAGFAIVNGRLPCPANGSIAADAASAGQEATTGTGALLICTTTIGSGVPSNSGVLPWATLGLSETDAWGRRFTYRVTSSFADGADGAGSSGGTAACTTSPTASGVSFQLCSNGNMRVLTASSGGTSLATNIPAIIISHGKNGFGAFTRTGTQITTVGADENEAENTDGVADTDYVDREIDLNPDTAATFDDIVVWVSPNILFSRMVAAGRLP